MRKRLLICTCIVSCSAAVLLSSHDVRPTSSPSITALALRLAEATPASRALEKSKFAAYRKGVEAAVRCLSSAVPEARIAQLELGADLRFTYSFSVKIASDAGAPSPETFANIQRQCFDQYQRSAETIWMKLAPISKSGMIQRTKLLSCLGNPSTPKLLVESVNRDFQGGLPCFKDSPVWSYSPL
jgi:hypothetical protein